MKRTFIDYEYFGIDVKLIWKTIKNDLPTLKMDIKKMLDLYQE